jgi:inosine-uridine nucleoside N-ribohydrolase
VWLDADTGNETDDVYAIARLLADPSVEVVGLSSAHFNNADLVAFEKWNQYPTVGIKTVEISQQLNEAILAAMGKSSIAHPIGADRQIGRAWGGTEPRKSHASDAIIAAVKSLKPGEKLDVLCIGALTNIASAIILDPGIIPFIRCFSMGAKYNMMKGAWSKNEFNIRGDLNAFDYLLDCQNLDLTIIPVESCQPFRFERDVLYAGLNDQIPIHKMMKDRWKETNPDDKIRTLWDLALVESYLNRDLTELVSVNTPPENFKRKVNVFTKIDVKAMKDDFWKSMKSFGSKK